MKRIFYDKYGRIKIKGFDSGLFWFGLIIKLVLAANFASNYLRDLFAPFLNFYISSGFADPYAHFIQLGQIDSFPYPALMLWLMSSARLLASCILPVDPNLVTNFDLFFYRIPILVADFCILLILLRWLKTHPIKVLAFYWLSPILIYINYVHGQLDAIPTALLFVSMYFLFKDKFVYAILILGLSIATKTHILILLPLFILYALKARIGRSHLILAFGSCLLAYFLISLPYLNSEAYLQMVFHNAKQLKVFDALWDFGDGNFFYIIPALYVALIAMSYSVRVYNRDIFIMFLGFSFCILTLFIPPMPGWYYWVTPFIIYFFIKQEKTPVFFLALNLCYFFYFLLRTPQLVHDVSFTLLQTTLFLNCFWIYRNGIRSNMQHKIKSEPYLIGIGGDSGSGKTTYSALIKDIFSEKNTTIICGDDMHKYERGHEMWQIYTHLNPKANDLHDEMEQVVRLKKGKKIIRRHYDHGVGKFTLPIKIRSNRVIIFEGLLPFYLSQMRSVYDLKVFIEPDEALRINWKLSRDANTRGRSQEEILQQIKNREEDSIKYIRSQEQYADLSIKFQANDNNLPPYLKLEFSNDINVDDLIIELEKQDELKIVHNYSIDKQVLEIKGCIDKASIEYIASELIPELDEIIITEPHWHSDYEGLLQLFTIYYIFIKMRMGLKANA